MTSGDPLLDLQEQAEAAVKQVAEMSASVPIYAAVYGYGEAITMLASVVGEMASALTPDEKGVVAEAIDSIVTVTRAADAAVSTVCHKTE